MLASPSAPDSFGTGAEELLRVKDLTIRYTTEAGDVLAVEDISFSVRRGERFVIIGRSGCGKSTLLNAIAGFLTPAAGVVELNGRPIQGPGPDRIVVFQEFDQLLPWKTVLGNVEYYLQVTGKVPGSAVRSRALENIRLVGLERFLDAYPHILSGGMKQRVAIARALAVDPQILLMDEPFGSLDALTRRQMQREMIHLWQKTRKTILFVTHSILEAVLLGDRILVLTPGPGRVKAIVENPWTGASDPTRILGLQAELESLIGLTEPAPPEEGVIE